MSYHVPLIPPTTSHPGIARFENDPTFPLRHRPPHSPTVRHPLPSFIPLCLRAQDYLSDAATVDLAYNALIDHAMAEKTRSPHVAITVVGLLKKYLFR